MKLFVSVNFDHASKDIIYEHMKLLFDKCESGVFTKKENIHLTLACIGETTQIGDVVNTLDAIDVPCFDITLSDGGAFNRSGGDIYWLGIDKSAELVKLQKSIYRNLFRSGVIRDKNDFRPHLTVSRDTVISKELVPEGKLSYKIPVKRISLMKCTADRDGCVFTEIYAKELKG